MTNISLMHGQSIAIAACSDAIIVCSGTASLECALINKPMCIIYKASYLTYIIAMKLIRIKYLGLCNLLQNKMIAPELLQYDCNPQALTAIIKTLLYDIAYIKKQHLALDKLKYTLSNHQADNTLDRLVMHYVGSTATSPNSTDSIF